MHLNNKTTKNRQTKFLKIPIIDNLSFFSSTVIKSYENKYYEDLIAYAIFNIKNRKKTDRIITKKVKPIVMRILKKFKERYNRKCFTDVNKFEEFSAELKTILKN